MRLGVSSAHVAYETVEELFEKLARYGFDLVEFWPTSVESGSAPDDLFHEIRTRAADGGIVVAYHAPYWIEWELTNPDLEAGLRSFDATLLTARKLGASHIVVHMGSEGDDRARALERVAGVLKAEATEISGEGFMVHVENVFSGLGSRPDDVAALLDALDAEWLGFNLDVGHAVLTGGAESWVERLGPLVTYMHVHDNDGRDDRHLAPGDGSTDWPALLERLHHTGFDGVVTLEYGERWGFEPTMAMVRRAFGGSDG